MSKTWWSVATAGLLTVLSLGVMAARWLLVGPQLDRPRGHSTWQVTLTAVGQLKANETDLTTARPPNFRQQHIEDEEFQAEGLTHRPGKGRGDGGRPAVWKKAAPQGPQSYKLSYSFHCVLGTYRPTNAMADLTRRLDAPPPPGEHLKPTALIESDNRTIADKAELLLIEQRVKADIDPTPAEQVRALYDFVAGLADRRRPGQTSALACLRQEGGDAAAKARLLAALCRSQSIPARLVVGLALSADRPAPERHTWVEAWVRDRWLPMDPAGRHFDEPHWPRNYLVLQVGGTRLVRGPTARPVVSFLVRPLGGPDGGDRSVSPVRGFFQRVSLYNLRPAEQTLAKFLLLLPVGAVVVSVFRTLIGTPTFGTFSPALLGLVFLDFKSLPYSLAVFVGVVLIGWVLRRGLDRYHLLLVPRTAILLTLIVTVLLVLIAVASHYGITATHVIALFPLVILTHLVERFWTVETEDGTPASFRTLAGTMLVAVTIAVVLNPEPPANWLLRRLGLVPVVPPEPVATWMFGHPETLGLVLAAQFLIGRYTGYRLSELYRFRDLIEEHPDASGAASAPRESARGADAAPLNADAAPLAGAPNPEVPP
jgi:hypothetical protein